MNLNLNRRLESYEISDDAGLADWIETIVDTAFAEEGAATIGEAAQAPAEAQRRLSTLAGTVASVGPMISHTGDGRGLSFD